MAARAVTRIGFVAMGFALAAAVWSPLMAAEADAGGAKAAPAPSGAVADIDRGRKIFDGSACGGCHTLAAAGATGEVGPSLDGDPKLTTAFVIDRVTNGQGGMPAFSGQLSDEDIAALAAYVVKASAK